MKIEKNSISHNQELYKEYILETIYHEINIPLAILRSQSNKLDKYGKEAIEKIEEILFNLRNM